MNSFKNFLLGISLTLSIGLLFEKFNSTNPLPVVNNETNSETIIQKPVIVYKTKPVIVYKEKPIIIYKERKVEKTTIAQEKPKSKNKISVISE